MTPDTAALRARLARLDATFTGPAALTLDADTVRALCDAADEVERLREEVRRMARDLAEYRKPSDGGTVMRCVNCSSPTCDGEACMDGPYQPRDAARTAHAALVADLRALCDQHIGAPCDCNAIAHSVRALLDRHAPEEGS